VKRAFEREDVKARFANVRRDDWHHSDTAGSDLIELFAPYRYRERKLLRLNHQLVLQPGHLDLIASGRAVPVGHE
jgi:hypothetical protein